MNQAPDSPRVEALLGIPMLRDSIPTAQMVIATVILGLLVAVALVR
jgi:hypothetical protein